MIGNDIIDLQVSKKSRWEEQRFLDKLFTPGEEEFILDGQSKFLNIWLLWSMKESVYKIVSRDQKNQRFNPKDFHCRVVSDTTNSVCFENKWFQTDTLIQNGFIHTIAYFKTGNIIANQFRLQTNDINTQSVEIKEACIKDFSNFKSIPVSSISLKNNHLGIPQMYVDDKLQNEKISISHHGCFGGFAIAI
ncbi:MAG: 4'-phosphopantetheinyl transferase superfamily protein [Gelidibacter sp.]